MAICSSRRNAAQNRGQRLDFVRDIGSRFATDCGIGRPGLGKRGAGAERHAIQDALCRQQFLWIFKACIFKSVMESERLTGSSNIFRAYLPSLRIFEKGESIRSRGVSSNSIAKNSGTH